MSLKISCAFRCWAAGYDLNRRVASILWSALISNMDNSNELLHRTLSPTNNCHQPASQPQAMLFPAVPMFYIWISALRFLWQVGRHYIVDATSEEESQMSSAVSVSVNRNGQVCGLTKRGGAGLDPSVIFDMISVARHVSQQFIAHLDSKISAAEAAAEWRGENSREEVLIHMRPILVTCCPQKRGENLRDLLRREGLL